MESGEFERRVLDELKELSMNVAGLRGEFAAYQEKTDSDIRELKNKGQKTRDSLTDLEMKTIRAEAIVAKQKWNRLMVFGWSLVKAIAVASIGGVGTLLWETFVKRHP